MTKTPSAGQQLRLDMDAALARAGRDLGQSLEFSEVELHTLARAAAAADRCEQIERLWQVELDRPQPRATSAANLAGELRLTEKAVVDLLTRVTLGTGPAKSDRHQRAARAPGIPLRRTADGRAMEAETVDASTLYGWLLQREEEAHPGPWTLVALDAGAAELHRHLGAAGRAAGR